MASEQEKTAISLKELIAEQNRLLTAQLQIENDRLKTNKEDLATQQDISNIIRDQSQSLKFQKAEKSAILRSTNSIAKVQEQLSVLDRKELGSKKLTLKLSNDISKVNKDIRLLELTKNKILKDQQGLTIKQVEANYVLAGSIDEQIEKALNLKSTLEDTANTTDKLNSNFGSKTFGFLDDLASKIPGLSSISKPLQTAAKASQDMASGIESAAMSGGKGLTKERIKQLGLEKQLGGLTGASAASKLKGMSSMQKGMLALKAGFKVLGPIIAAAFGPVVIITQLLSALVKGDKAAGDMAKSMNITTKAALGTRIELRQMAESQLDINNLSAGNAVTTEGLQETLTSINKTLGTSTMLSEDMLVQFTQMRKMAGFTNEELIGIAKISLTTGKDMESITGEFMAQAQISSTALGVKLNEKDLLKDIGKISAATTLSLGKNPKLIGEAVATAKSLGMEMSKIEGIADSLLNFESSISNEMEAELLTGKELNLEKARTAALNNDMATVAEEISRQAGGAAEFGKMNRIQQEALAKSVGMTRDSLAETLFIQEQLKGATGDQAKEQEALLNKRIAEVGLAQAQKELAEDGIEGLKNQQSQAERLANTIDKLKEVFVILAEPILAVGMALMPIIEGIGFLIGGIMSISTAIGKFIGKMKEMGTIGKVVGGIFAVLAAALAYGALAWIPVVGPVLGLAAGAAIMTSYFSAVSDAEKVGDMFSPADGKTQVSTKEGGLFELSKNDDLVAFPGASKAASEGQNKQNNIVENTVDMSTTNSLLEQLISLVRTEGTVYLDATKVGTAMSLSNYKMQ